MRARPLAAALLLALPACGGEERPRLVLATTHTLEDSGILDSLAAGFRADHPGQPLHVVVSGSGEALQYARRGDADVVLSHAPDTEQRLLRGGWIADLRPVMHNDFVLLGPAADPAGIRGAPDAVSAFRRLRDARATFVSRGDDSGTHQREQALWQRLATLPQWPGYVEAGVGMADALRLASSRGSYILADRATWLTLREQLRLELLLDGDTALVNRYSVARSWRPRNPEGARAFITWVTSESTQQRIGRYGQDRFPRPLFIPGAPVP